jgi:hypothetical protein
MSRHRWNAQMLKPAIVAGASAFLYSGRPDTLETPARG